MHEAPTTPSTTEGTSQYLLCKDCGETLGRNIDGDWLDTSGSTICGWNYPWCPGCADGEDHPHVPTDEPTYRQVVEYQVEAAANGDSNDDEIATLQQLVTELLDRLEPHVTTAPRPWSSSPPCTAHSPAGERS